MTIGTSSVRSGPGARWRRRSRQVHAGHHDGRQHERDVRVAVEDVEALAAVLGVDDADADAAEHTGEREGVADVVVETRTRRPFRTRAGRPLSRRADRGRSALSSSWSARSPLLPAVRGRLRGVRRLHRLPGRAHPAAGPAVGNPTTSASHPPPPGLPAPGRRGVRTCARALPRTAEGQLPSGARRWRYGGGGRAAALARTPWRTPAGPSEPGAPLRHRPRTARRPSFR